jgi:hypothetical protein
MGKVGRQQLSALHKASLDDDRVWIPPAFCDFGRLTGTEAHIECWFLMVVLGRYRIAPKAIISAEETGTLKRSSDLAETYDEVPGLFRIPKTSERSLLPIRIMSVEAELKDEGRRVKLPKELKLLVPRNENEGDNFVFLVPVAGLIEFWFPETLRRGLSVSITEILY